MRMRMRMWCWVWVWVAAAFISAVQAQIPDLGLGSTTPTTTTITSDASSLAVSLAGSGSASPIPDSCPTGTGQLSIASDQLQYVLVCSVDYPNNDLVAYNAGSIADCIQTCENVNAVEPNAPCVGITYTPSYSHGYSCPVKYKLGNAQSETYEVDTAILVPGVKHVSAIASSTISAITATNSTSAAIADDGCPTTNGTTLYSSTSETYYLLCGVDFPNNRVGDISGLNMQECVQQCSYANTAVGNGTCAGVTYENGTCYPLSQANSGDSTPVNGTDSAVIYYQSPPVVSSSTSAASSPRGLVKQEGKEILSLILPMLLVRR